MNYNILKKAKFSLSMYNSTFLHSKPVLYIILALVLVNLMANTIAGNYRYVSSLFLIGFLISQFTKNMSVILLFSLLISNVIVLLWRGDVEKMEGFEDEKKDKEKDEEKDEETTKAVEDEVKNNEEVKKLIDDKGKLVELKKDAEDLLSTQKQILDGLNKIEPLLTRAEVLSEKFSNMKGGAVAK